MENSIKMDDLGVPLFLETPIYIFGNNPPQMVLLGGSKYWRNRLVWRLDSGPNLQPCVTDMNALYAFLCHHLQDVAFVSVTLGCTCFFPRNRCK